MAIQRFSYAERPDLAAQLEGEEAGAFPAFLLHDRTWEECWPHLLDEFAEFQLVLYDADRDVVVGGANSVPLRWDGTIADLPAGTHAAMLRSIDEHAHGVEPNTICGVQSIATRQARGQGLSEEFVRLSRQRREERGCEHGITPLRLLLKERYPITPIADYVGWRREDGSPFDPWLRVWLRAGAQILEVCEDSLVIEGTVEEWQEWTGMEFPASGRFVIPGGQVVLEVDRDRNRGRYSEPHLWIETTAGD